MSDNTEEVPICHMKPMSYESADDWPNGSVEFWECQYCGRTKEVGRNYHE